MVERQNTIQNTFACLDSISDENNRFNIARQRRADSGFRDAEASAEPAMVIFNYLTNNEDLVPAGYFS